MSSAKLSPPKRRRWLQFSLRSFFVLTFLVAGFLGWLRYEVSRARREEQAVRAIWESGGWVMHEHDRAIFHPEEPPGPEWLKRILGKNFFARVSAVGVARGLGDADIAPL